MKEMDCVEVAVEKERYAKYGVHEGMQGWICDPRSIDGTWLVNFPQCGENDDIATLDIQEVDLRLLPNGMNAAINEKIKAEFEKGEGKEDISDYLV